MLTINVTNKDLLSKAESISNMLSSLDKFERYNIVLRQGTKNTLVFEAERINNYKYPIKIRKFINIDEEFKVPCILEN